MRTLIVSCFSVFFRIDASQFSSSEAHAGYSTEAPRSCWHRSPSHSFRIRYLVPESKIN